MRYQPSSPAYSTSNCCVISLRVLHFQLLLSIFEYPTSNIRVISAFEYSTFNCCFINLRVLHFHLCVNSLLVLHFQLLWYLPSSAPFPAFVCYPLPTIVVSSFVYSTSNCCVISLGAFHFQLLCYQPSCTPLPTVVLSTFVYSTSNCCVISLRVLHFQLLCYQPSCTPLQTVVLSAFINVSHPAFVYCQPSSSSYPTFLCLKPLCVQIYIHIQTSCTARFRQIRIQPRRNTSLHKLHFQLCALPVCVKSTSSSSARPLFVNSPWKRLLHSEFKTFTLCTANSH